MISDVHNRVTVAGILLLFVDGALLPVCVLPEVVLGDSSSVQPHGDSGRGIKLSLKNEMFNV